MIIQGDCREILRTGPAESVQCCVTSPPYWGLRDYGTAEWEGGDAACSHRVGGQVQDSKAKGAIVAGVRPGVDASRCLDCGARRVDRQLGLEATPEEYVANMVEVFREVRRVLRPDGVLWLNLGDSYNAYNGNRGASTSFQSATEGALPDLPGGYGLTCKGLKPKDLVGIPWRVAFALQADGWYLRQDIIWHKPNPMPESVRDRCTKAHEYLFLLTKEPRYYFDSEAIKEPATTGREAKYDNGRNGHGGGESHEGQGSSTRKFGSDPAKRNRRSVWTITTKPFKEAHFATFPPDLVRPCIQAGTSEAGACSDCGAPWERVVERTKMEVRAAPSREERSEGGRLRTQTNGTMTKPPTTTTIGWEAACTCGAPPIPCTVLDPFAGAGTTGLVSDDLGRAFVGIELNPEYVEIANKRRG